MRLNMGGEMYFKAEICLMTETYVQNDRDQGIDPDTTQDNGVIQTITAKDLEELGAKLNRQLNLKDFELFEGRLEGGFDERESDGTWVCNQYSIFIYQVETTPVDASFLKIA